jgi:L-alanine-DL-glutamate epimerase-like enolase superfamily enzyme
VTRLNLRIEERWWEKREPFGTARGISTGHRTLEVTILDEAGVRGRGESVGVPYQGETVETMRPQLEAVRGAIEQGISRSAVQALLPAGGARFAIDAALWDYEAKRDGAPAWRTAGLGGLRPVLTAYTIGIRDVAEFERTAERHADFPLLKVKVNGERPLAALQAVRRGAPDARLIVDPNQSWSLELLKEIAPACADLGVVLIEQPIAIGQEAGLEGYRCPVPLCADELIDTADQLDRAIGRFDAVNIKLDKAGGLTEALRLADAVDAAGMRKMVGCMAGSSLCMAPAFLLAQRCDFVDLDGPLLQVEDWPDGLGYRNGWIEPAPPGFWG